MPLPGVAHRAAAAEPGAAFSEIDTAAAADERLDSSAASLAAQAALDAADQLALAEASSSTIVHEPQPAAVKTPTAAAAAAATRTPRVFQTASDRTLEGNYEGVDETTVESLSARSPHRQHDTEAVEGPTLGGASATTLSSVVSAPHRQPPPPPPPPQLSAANTTTTVTHPSQMSMHPDADDAESDDDSSASRSGTELTVEQHKAPMTQGTLTHATSLEVAQAAVAHSASLLPPTLSSGSSSSSNTRGGQHRHSQNKSRAAGVNSSNNNSDDDDEGTLVVSPPHRTLDRSGTNEQEEEEEENGTLPSVPTLGVMPTATATAAGEEAPLAMGVKQQQHLQLLRASSMHVETHGETQTAAIATTATTGEESPSRLSGVLMPPSPSQPRVGHSPRSASFGSTNDEANAASAEVRVIHPDVDGSAASVPRKVSALAPLHPPTPPRSSDDEDSDELPRQQQQQQRQLSGGGGMRMAPAPSSSSSSGDDDDDAPRPAQRKIRSSSSSSSSVSDDGLRAEVRPAERGLAGTAQRVVRPMPMISSGDDTSSDGRGDGGDDNEVAGEVRAEGNGSLYTPTASSASYAGATPLRAKLDTFRFGSEAAGAAVASKTHSEDFSQVDKSDEEEEEVLNRDEDEEEEEGNSEAWNDALAAQRSRSAAEDPQELQEAGRWDDAFRNMELVDCTLVSRVYQQSVPRRSRESHSEADESDAAAAGEDVTLFKVLSLFPVVAVDERARWRSRTEVQQRLLRLAEDMRETQRRLDEAGLTAAGVACSASASHNGRGEEESIEGVRSANARLTCPTCSGITAVYVDASCRLIAQLEAETYLIPLRHLLPAVCNVGLQEKEIVALLRSAVCKAAAMHRADFVHGALHSGNVLFSSYDGDAVLTQPCGLMSQSAALPSDLSVLSVARACAMASDLPKVWGARRLHVKRPTSTRLGTPSRPDINELITYHSLAALGWDVEKRGEGEEREDAPDASTGIDDARESSQSTSAYTPTAADDVYALGMLAFLLYTGVPPFHMTSLWAAVERLGVLAGDYEAALETSRREARRHIAAFCFGERHARSGSSTSSSSTSGTSMRLPDLFTCGYGMVQRHAIARLQPDFEQALQNFIVDCVEASCVDALGGGDDSAASPLHKNADGCGPHYRTAQDLLDAHALFQRFDLADEGDEHTSDGEEDALSAEERMRDRVHRVAFPAFCAWTRARQECGSAPHLARLHSNAIFSARYAALCESLVHVAEGSRRRHHHASCEREGDAAEKVLSTLCPAIVSNVQAWHPLVPSVATSTGEGQHCVYGDPASAVADASSIPVFRSAVAALAAQSGGVSSLIRPSAAVAPSWLTDDVEFEDENGGDGAASEAADAALALQMLQSPPSSACEFSHYPHLHALVLANKESASFSLSRAFIQSRLSYAADTLVLQHLQECTVTILSAFRYVVLDDVSQCEVRLGPCETCVLRRVRDCRMIAVAAHAIAGADVSDTHISWSGQGGRQPVLEASHNVTYSLYSLAYAGLAEDYRRVGLPLEHAASLRVEDGGSTNALHEAGTAAAVRHRAFELLATTASAPSQSEIGLCLTPEAPYSHALIASGTRYVHRGAGAAAAVAAAPTTGKSNADDGARDGTEESDVFHYYGELQGKDVLICDVHGTKAGTLASGAVRRPVIVVHDALGDVTVERCSFCTVVVTGTASSLHVADCHNCQLILMARETMVERCRQMDCVALVTEYLLLRGCRDVRVRPLFLDCPYGADVLRKVVLGSLGGAEEETVVAAYEANRFDLLNVVLRGVGQGVHVEDSIDVAVEDLHYYYYRSGHEDEDDAEEEEAAPEERWLSVFTIPCEALRSPRQQQQQQQAGGASDSDDDEPQDDTYSSETIVAAAHALADELAIPVYTEMLQRYEDASDGDVATAAQLLREEARHAVAFHDLVDCSVLRLRGAMCPVRTAEQIAAEAADQQDATMPESPLVDVRLERVHYGVLYIEDAVSTLHLRHCVGPLDVVVCAATTVVMEGCVGVQLRTACVDFRAMDCAGCHVALHVNNRPQFQRCTSMETSVLNITARDFDLLLAAASVDPLVNEFAAPLLLTPSWAPAETAEDGAAAAPVATLAAEAIHAYCTGTRAAAADSRTVSTLCAALHSAVAHSGNQHVAVEQTPLIMALLRQPVTVVAPLAGLCVSPQESPFLEELEAQVAQWTGRHVPAHRTDVVAVALRALADVADVYVDVPEWSGAAAATPADAPQEEPEEVRASASDAASLSDVPPVEAELEQQEVVVEVLGDEASAAHARGEESTTMALPPSAPQMRDTVDDDDDTPSPVQVSEVRVQALSSSVEDQPQQPQLLVATVGAMEAPEEAAESRSEGIEGTGSEDEKDGDVEEEVHAEEASEGEEKAMEEDAGAAVRVLSSGPAASAASANAANSAEAVVASVPTPHTEKPDEDDGAEEAAAVSVEGVAEHSPFLTAVHHDPQGGLFDASHAANRPSTIRTSLHAPSTTSSASSSPEFSEPLPSQSPLASSLGPSPTALSEQGNYSSSGLLHATTTTIAAPIVGMSVSSSVGMPPMAPGPAYALSATDVGASAVMDIFNRTCPSAVISSMVRQADAEGPTLQTAAVEVIADDAQMSSPSPPAAARRASASARNEDEDPEVRAYDSLTDTQPTPPLLDSSSPAPHDVSGVPGVPALRATANRFARTSTEEGEDGDWAHSPPIETLRRESRSEHDSGGSAMGQRMPEKPAVPPAAAAAAADTQAVQVPHFLTPTAAFPLAAAAAERTPFSRQTSSSSVSDYPHRGGAACDDSATRGAGLAEPDGAQRHHAGRQATNFLHFSQESSSRRGEYSLPPSHLAVNGMSPLVSPGDHRMPGSGSFAVHMGGAVVGGSGVEAAGAEAGMRELMRQVEEARQRYARRHPTPPVQHQQHEHHQQQQQNTATGAAETLEARVRAAVAKLRAMKVVEEVA